MSKNKVTTLAVTGDSSANEGVKAAQEMLNQLTLIHESSFKTSGQFTGGGVVIDVKSSIDIPILVQVYGFLAPREQAYNDACDELGVDVPVFKINGYTTDDWKHDIKLRIAMVQSKATYDELKAIEAEWKTFQTEQDRKANLAERMNILAGKIVSKK